MATSKRSRRSVGSESISKIAIAAANAPVAAADEPGRRPTLLRNSSSASLLDAGNGTPPDGTNKSSKTDVFPKLRRKSGSLQDVNTAVGNVSRRNSEVKPKKKSARQQNRRASGWNTPTSSSSPSLPQIQSDSSPSKSLSRLSSLSQPNTGGRPLKSKKAGDIELVREATISVVVKYQRKFVACIASSISFL